jgi:large subunit ribosomal protein L19
MTNSLLTKVINKNKRTDTPEFRPGDTIRVHVKIKEGDKERLQAFEGTVIARNNTGMGESITVRKVSFGQGVERIFPIHARVIDHIDVVRTGRVRRAKLYYLRGLKGKAARLRERVGQALACHHARRTASHSFSLRRNAGARTPRAWIPSRGGCG